MDPTQAELETFAANWEQEVAEWLAAQPDCGSVAVSYTLDSCPIACAVKRRFSPERRTRIHVLPDRILYWSLEAKRPTTVASLPERAQRFVSVIDQYSIGAGGGRKRYYNRGITKAQVKAALEAV